MINMRLVAIASFGFLFAAQSLIAQTPFRYREYALGSTVASVVQTSGTRKDDTKTLHDRPGHIQELEWRAPYVPTAAEMPDPVRDVRFSFYNDALYQLVVTYDHDRMEGLTNGDVIESVSAIYGVPLLRHARVPLPAADATEEATLVAQWEDAGALLTLTRGTYSRDYQLVLISKTLNPRAAAAIREALRLDTQEAPQRELDQRKKDVAEARAASDKARVVNKVAFKP
jgi:hypothetical protein